MVRRVLEIIYERHDEWVYLVQAFGCNKDTAEDITQEMYLRMHKVVSKGRDVMYNETEVNAYYVLKTLKSIFIDMKRKELEEDIKKTEERYEKEDIEHEKIINSGF